MGTSLYAVNCNGAKGQISITWPLDEVSGGPTGGDVSGFAFIDPGFTDPMSGTWNPSANEVLFRREVQKFPGVVQIFHGYLFGTANGLVDLKDYPTVSLQVIAGYFEQSDTPGVRFGWFGTLEPVPPI